MEPETAKKIVETVEEILRDADLDLMTEFKVRAAASSRLCLDLSGFEHRAFVRKVVEAFLLSAPDGEASNSRENVRGKEEAAPLDLTAAKEKDVLGEQERFICNLSDKRAVVVNVFRGKQFVSIREYFQRTGKPSSSKWVHLSTEQWSKIKKNLPEIEEAIKKLQSKVSSNSVAEHQEDLTNAEAKCGKFIPLDVSRFNGKNYRRWAYQMQAFLKQLGLAYVLADPCPSSTLDIHSNAEGHPTTNWLRDEHLCRHHLLNSLCDELYHRYSEKFNRAKDLWDELASIYLHEEFGTKRSVVRKYMHYQMDEDRPVLEQIQEFNKIADMLAAEGISLDENFHVSAAISKFPPCWKGFCVKLLNDEHLPMSDLMQRVEVEEELRGRTMKAGKSRCLSLPATRIGPSTRETEKTNFPRLVMFCKACGKKGHTARFCWAKKPGQECI